jgi:hypothetical protein
MTVSNTRQRQGAAGRSLYGAEPEPAPSMPTGKRNKTGRQILKLGHYRSQSRIIRTVAAAGRMKQDELRINPLKLDNMQRDLNHQTVRIRASILEGRTRRARQRARDSGVILGYSCQCRLPLIEQSRTKHRGFHRQAFMQRDR